MSWAGPRGMARRGPFPATSVNTLNSLNDLDLVAGMSLAAGSSTRTSLPRRPLSTVSVVPILARRVLRATVVSDSAWEEEVISDATLEASGLHTEDLVMHSETVRLTGQFEWRVAVQRKFLDLDWTPTGGAIAAGDLVLPAQAASGYTIGSVFADRGRLGLRIRLLLQWHTRATGGGAIGDMAEVSLAMASRRWA